MTRLLPIDDCDDCIFVHTIKHGNVVCYRAGRELVKNAVGWLEIPEWCPLEKVKDETG